MKHRRRGGLVVLVVLSASALWAQEGMAPLGAVPAGDQGAPPSVVSPGVVETPMATAEPAGKDMKVPDDDAEALAGVLGLLVGLIMLGLMQLALWTLTLVMAPDAVRRTRQLIQTSQRACFLYGLSFALIILVLSALKAWLLALLLLLAVAFAAQIGGAAAVGLVAEKLPAEVASAAPLKRFLGGGALLFVACCLPLVGWLLGLYVVLLGAGAYSLTLPIWPRRRPRQAPPAPPESQEGESA